MGGHTERAAVDGDGKLLVPRSAGMAVVGVRDIVGRRDSMR